MRICVRSFLNIAFCLIGITACQAKEIISIQSPQSDTPTSFNVALATTHQDQEHGLMFVKTMPDDEGMLFVYPYAQPTKFWMKNTLIPLDILFFDTTNTLVHIERNAQPHDLTLRGPAYDVQICSVLELNGGQAQKQKIEMGAKLLSNLTQECLQSISK